MPEQLNVAAENLKTLQEQRQIRQAVKNLMENTDFAWFMEHLKKQQEYRMKEVLQMPQCADDVVKRTYVAGELAMISVVIGMPELLYETATQQIQMCESYIARDEEQERYDNAEDSDDTD